MSGYRIVTVALPYGQNMRVTVPRGAIDSVLFLGVGQRGKNLYWVANEAPERMAVVEALPYMRLKQTSDIKPFAQQSIQIVLELLAVQNGKYDVYAESQAAPSVVFAVASRAVPQPRQMILLAPLGCNVESFGQQADVQYKNVLQRSRKSWQRQSLLQRSERETLRQIVAETLLCPAHTKRMYQFGIRQNSVHEIKAIASSGIPVHIYAGSDDPLFPYSEIVQQFNERGTNITLHRYETRCHVNRANPVGLQQLNTIYTSYTKNQ
ncbi:MAG: hypothetical protein WAQ25_04015 [Candidatus Saccharimonas sp.]